MNGWYENMLIFFVDFLKTSHFGGRMTAYLDPSRVANSIQTPFTLGGIRLDVYRVFPGFPNVCQKKI